MALDVRKGSGKQKKRHIDVQVVEDLDSITNISCRNIAPSASVILEDATGPSKKFKMTGNMICFFYNDSTANAKNGITQEEIDIASGRIALSESNAAEFLEWLEKKSENIQKAFAMQEERSKDQEQFERLLAGWVVTCDQPFEEVEWPEFRHLLEYIFRGTSLKISGRHKSWCRYDTYFNVS
ncbi:hypothetical protein BDQ17DRAFT_1435834 [Cyathus striatus]|nr:hypothetical protein BDQ17DRAFT_1435834 [Cyathus striatus]